MKTYPDFSLELKYWLKYGVIAGIDEAGRGPVAGPVSAAAVVLPKDFSSDVKIDDSKKLSAKKREEFAEMIRDKSLSFAVSMIGNEEIDNGNILKSTMTAMQSAVGSLSIKPDFLLIDGNYYSNGGYAFETIVRGDSKSVSIAAASILAKVERDKWMTEVAHSEYPEYDFASNKGYGTKSHFEKIREFGPCPYHRMTFLRKLFGSQSVDPASGREVLTQLQNQTAMFDRPAV